MKYVLLNLTSETAFYLGSEDWTTVFSFRTFSILKSEGEHMPAAPMYLTDVIQACAGLQSISSEDVDLLYPFAKDSKIQLCTLPDYQDSVLLRAWPITGSFHASKYIDEYTELELHTKLLAFLDRKKFEDFVYNKPHIDCVCICCTLEWQLTSGILAAPEGLKLLQESFRGSSEIT